MKLIFEWRGVEVWGAAISKAEGETMRTAERRTASEMARALFGPENSIDHDADGAPILARGGAEISVSHGAGMLVMAVGRSGNRVGVDIESPRPQLQRVARKFVVPDDSSDLSLLQLWTAKEAAFKAAGIAGLVISEIAIEGATALLPDGRKLPLYFYPLPDGALIALAVAADGSPEENRP